MRKCKQQVMVCPECGKVVEINNEDVLTIISSRDPRVAKARAKPGMQKWLRDLMRKNK